MTSPSEFKQCRWRLSRAVSGHILERGRMRHRGRWLAVLLALLVLAPATSRAVGTASVPNNLSAQSGPTANLSLVDSNFTSLLYFINAREITLVTLVARPAVSTSGRLYVS